MAKRLKPYGSADQAHNLSKVGKSKTPISLAARMPSAEVAAKVGQPPAINVTSEPAEKVRVRRLNSLV